MDLSASLRLGFPSVQYVVIQLRRKTCGPPCIQAHPPRLGYELCEDMQARRIALLLIENDLSTRRCAQVRAFREKTGGAVAKPDAR
jgi:hypothetical protein